MARSAITRGMARLNGGFACYGIYRTRDERYLAVEHTREVLAEYGFSDAEIAAVR